MPTHTLVVVDSVLNNALMNTGFPMISRFILLMTKVASNKYGQVIWCVSFSSRADMLGFSYASIIINP